MNTNYVYSRCFSKVQAENSREVTLATDAAESSAPELRLTILHCPPVSLHFSPGLYMFCESIVVVIGATPCAPEEARPPFAENSLQQQQLQQQPVVHSETTPGRARRDR